MKAMLCREFGPIDNLAWVDSEPPACGPRQVRYRTTVATLGFMDTLMVRGLYQVKPPLPYIPGSVSAGVVTQVGPEVEGIRTGQRITASDYYGAFAEERVVVKGNAHVVIHPEPKGDEPAGAPPAAGSPAP